MGGYSGAFSPQIAGTDTANHHRFDHKPQHTSISSNSTQAHLHSTQYAACCAEAMDSQQAPAFAAPLVYISTHVEECGAVFRSLVTALAEAPHFAAQARLETVNDEFDRFKIWAGNIGAYKKGRRSLEYRLRDAVHLKAETLNLLAALEKSLTIGQSN